MTTTLVADSKELAGATFADVAARTRDLFPDPAYRPQRGATGPLIPFGPHTLSVNSDGTGTKPELIERLFSETGDYSLFERPAHDVVAMVADDAARNGHYTVGIVNCVDVNSAADVPFVSALAQGMEQACRSGRFPLINGETAELSHRAPGLGSCRLNWNAVALALVNRAKEYQASNLRPGQPLVALRERTIRSNGLSRVRAILEHAFLSEHSHSRTTWLSASISRVSSLHPSQVAQVVTALLDEHPELAEQVHIPWHSCYPELTERMSRPSTIYSALITDAQGPVDGPVSIPLVTCAHITGGGIPLKVRRMLAQSGLGAAIEPVFPDPEGLTELMDLALNYPRQGVPLVDDRGACEQWNRGIGFVCVAPDLSVARALEQRASELGFEAALAGQIIDRREVTFRGHVWSF